jgi:hypothetical protein
MNKKASIILCLVFGLPLAIVFVMIIVNTLEGNAPFDVTVLTNPIFISMMVICAIPFFIAALVIMLVTNKNKTPPQNPNP